MIGTAIIGAIAKLAGSTVTPVVTQWMEGKQQEEKLKHDLKRTELEGKIKVKVAEAEAKAQAAQDRETYDLTALQLQATTWKDEVLLLIIFAPSVLLFVPGLDDIAFEGIKRLAEVPGWVQALQIGIVSAVYGLRWMKGK